MASCSTFSTDNLRRKPTLRSFPVTESLMFVDSDETEKPPHFLDSCALCFRRLRPDSDIFMYKGDTPFCSEECRQEQIEKDEVAEKSRTISLASTKKNNNKKKQKKSSSTTSSRAGAEGHEVFLQRQDAVVTV